MPLSPRQCVAGISPCVHGGIDYEEMEKLGISPDSVVDFSVCTNPFGPPPSVTRALRSLDVKNYPDSRCTRLRRALASFCHVPESNVLVTSGSTEAIRLLALAYLEKGDNVVVPQPAYGDYEVACRLAGCSVIGKPGPRDRNLRFDVGEIVSVVAEYRPKMLFLGNPVNPTGQYFSKREIESLLDVSEDTLLVLDEAYASFVSGRWSSEPLLERRNLVVLRSMTKDYALAGLRLGYVLAHESVVSLLQKVQSPWSVNAAAQVAGLAAISEIDYLEGCRRRISAAKNFLVSWLGRLGMEPLPSEANFFLVRVGDAAHFRRVMLSRGFLVRDCASFGLPEYVRLGVRAIRECRRLVRAIKVSGVVGS